MADERDEFTLFDVQVEILDDDRLAFRRRINLCQLGQFDVIAHISTVSSLISPARFGLGRPEKMRGGRSKSSGSMSGKISFFVMDVCRSPLESSMNVINSRRISLNRA